MADDEGFIGLPPGIVPPVIDQNSGTVRRERSDRLRTERSSDRSEIVFFPVVPGVPAPTPVEPEVDDATVASAPRHAGARWRLQISGRDPIAVEGTVFLGRNPVATAEHPGARTISVDDEAKSVSKTHAMLELDDAGLWVSDLDSTNGVWVVPADGEAIEVIPGTRAAVPAGSDLELGDVVIQIEHS